MGFRGRVDSVDGRIIRGWAVNDDGDPCLVCLVIDGNVVAQTVSDKPRPDLIADGVSSGLGGFWLNIPKLAKPLASNASVAFEDGTQLSGGASLSLAPPAEQSIPSSAGQVESVPARLPAIRLLANPDISQPFDLWLQLFPSLRAPVEHPVRPKTDEQGSQ